MLMIVLMMTRIDNDDSFNGGDAIYGDTADCDDW